MLEFYIMLIYYSGIFLGGGGGFAPCGPVSNACGWAPAPPPPAKSGHGGKGSKRVCPTYTYTPTVKSSVIDHLQN